jgi:hypothetical protein
MKREGIRLAFAPPARAAFEAFSNAVRAGIRRRLREFGEKPAIGKPLIGLLDGYHRLSYGPARAASLRIVARVDGNTVFVCAIHIGLRKANALDDPYDIASSALAHEDHDAVAVLEALVDQVQAGEVPELVDPNTH